jgi:hypothetical protein
MSYRVFMFTPGFPGNSQEVTGLSIEQAWAQVLEWEHKLAAENYTRMTPLGNYTLNFYRPDRPALVRVIIREEPRHGKAQQVPAPGAQE